MPRSGLRSLRRAFRLVWSERQGFARRRDWLAHFYNGIVNRSPLPLPGRGRAWGLRLRGIDGPVWVRQGSRDWVALREVLIEGEYDFVLAHLAGEPIRRVVDLGANVGMTVRLWRQRFPDAAVVAVEPAAESLAMCRRNAAAAPAAGGATVFLAAGIAAHGGRGHLDRSGEPMTFRTGRGAAGGEAVELVTMEQALAAAGFDGADLVKCDVEGAERELLADCRGWIGRVRWLVVELHDGYRAEDLLADLAANGARPSLVARKPKRPPVEVALVRLETAAGEAR